jgi:peptidase S51-like protein
MSGKIIINGNARAEADLIYATRDHILNSNHIDPQIRAERTVTLITAAWCENEHSESHIKKALYEVGIEPSYKGDYDQRVVNLSVFHAFSDFQKKDPGLAKAFAERDELIADTRKVYLDKNGFYTQQMRRAFEHIRRFQPDATLTRILKQAPLKGHRIPGRFRGTELLRDFLAEDLDDTVSRLVENDHRLTRLITDLDRQFREGVGLNYHPVWLGLRRSLEKTLLNSSTVIIFGGNLEHLHRSLSFFDLRSAFVEALRRGTTFITVSAGSLLMCERIILFNDFAHGKEFQLFDRGFGMVRNLQIFPHCDDRIQVDDANNLAYLAHRFGERKCVGLNEGSFLLLDQNEEFRAHSMGKDDGVYVFDQSGRKVRYDFGESLEL